MVKRKDIYRSAGETRALTRTLRHPETGEVMDLTGCTVTFYAIDSRRYLGQEYGPLYDNLVTVTNTDVLEVDGGSVSVTGATTGAVSYAVATTVFEVPATYYFQFKVVDGSSLVTLTPPLSPDADVIIVSAGLPDLST